MEYCWYMQIGCILNSLTQPRNSISKQNRTESALCTCRIPCRWCRRWARIFCVVSSVMVILTPLSGGSILPEMNTPIFPSNPATSPGHDSNQTEWNEIQSTLVYTYRHRHHFLWAASGFPLLRDDKIPWLFPDFSSIFFHFPVFF